MTVPLFELGRIRGYAPYPSYRTKGTLRVQQTGLELEQQGRIRDRVLGRRYRATLGAIVQGTRGDEYRSGGKKFPAGGTFCAVDLHYFLA